MSTDNTQTYKKTLGGKIVKKALEQTVTVLVDEKRPHSKYKKYIHFSKKFLVHVPEGFECNEGDQVEIEACKPISKRKNFVLKSIIKKAEQIA